MLKKMHNKKAQNTAEYAILIALVIGGVVAMQTYGQRALQARVRDTSQFMTDNTANLLKGVVPSSTEKYDKGQYEPYYTHSNETSSKQSDQQHMKSGDQLVLNGTVNTSKVNQLEFTEYTGDGKE